MEHKNKYKVEVVLPEYETKKYNEYTVYAFSIKEAEERAMACANEQFDESVLGGAYTQNAKIIMSGDNCRGHYEPKRSDV
jgi:hypothetical protein